MARGPASHVKKEPTQTLLIASNPSTGRGMESEDSGSRLGSGDRLDVDFLALLADCAPAASVAIER